MYSYGLGICNCWYGYSTDVSTNTCIKDEVCPKVLNVDCNEYSFKYNTSCVACPSNTCQSPTDEKLCVCSVDSVFFVGEYGLIVYPFCNCNHCMRCTRMIHAFYAAISTYKVFATVTIGFIIGLLITHVV